MSALRPLVDFGLTTAEERIATELSLGQSNKQIAARLWLSEETIKYHMTRILRKTGARNRTHAAAILYRAGR